MPLMLISNKIMPSPQPKYNKPLLSMSQTQPILKVLEQALTLMGVYHQMHSRSEQKPPYRARISCQYHRALWIRWQGKWGM